ncbi:hypothetical protein KZX50_22965, partial [Bacillus infantis]|uniref:hypothetical protein n=1 Tax=Bacillus infantis TaxID=324767 RepID=UPI0020032488
MPFLVLPLNSFGGALSKLYSHHINFLCSFTQKVSKSLSKLYSQRLIGKMPVKSDVSRGLPNNQFQQTLFSFN